MFYENRIRTGGIFLLALLTLTSSAAVTAKSSVEELIIEGELSHKKGDLNQAAESIETALQHLDTDSNLKLAGIAWTELGFVRLDQGRLAEAERLFRSALAACAKRSEEGTRDRIVATGNLALVLIDEARYTEADRLTSSALEQASAAFGTNSGQYAKLLGARAKIAMSRGQMTSAIRLLTQEADIVTARPLDRQELGEVYQNLAVVAVQAGKTDLALSSLEKARQAWLAFLPEDHPAQLVAENTRICVYIKARQYQKAWAASQSILPRAERTLSPDDPRLAAILNNVGVISEHEKREQQAADAFHRAYLIDLKSLGQFHPTTACALFSYGKAIAKCGQSAEGATLQRRATAYLNTLQ